jgi:hypothetical protein
MLCHFQRRESFVRHFQDRGGFLAHIGFGMMITGLTQFCTLLVA